MSLPPAQKDISVHPAHSSVVDPVNQAEASRDVDRKVSIFIFAVSLVHFMFFRLYYMA